MQGTPRDTQYLCRMLIAPGTIVESNSGSSITKEGAARMSTWATSLYASAAASSQRCCASPCAVPLAAGAFAGMTVEATLFPLDSLKTRLQSGVGFRQAGGFRSIYRGVGVTAIGAIPASAIFFCTYECMKERHGSVLLASITGEMAASSVRVPVDIVKQRLQSGLARNFAESLQTLRATPGRHIFTVFRISAARDVVHSGLQYPLYEHLKCMAAQRSRCESPEDLPVWMSATCGSAAGAASAWATTPLDLLRTRLNLRSGGSSSSILQEVRELSRSEGGLPGKLRSLFAGAGCRCAWMGLGGFIFLGSFELVRKQLRGASGGSSAGARSPMADASMGPSEAANGGLVDFRAGFGDWATVC
mmetsp:Transcript_146385/g.469664  ORF Transcript_146385/g.469664 Transcript_146385/m.469664 type:complete len:361 (+) Transcript_146385:52-1134(+)